MVAPGQAEIRPALAPAPAPGEARLRALVGSISRGTESLVFHGRVPESERLRMRAPFQEGEFPFPVKYGYALVGLVEEGPADLTGRRVFCLHPHQTRATLPVASLLPVPAAVSDERAALAAAMETALNATWDGAPAIGDRIAVIGAGAVGSLVAYLCARLPETDVTLIDPDPARRTLAGAWGARYSDGTAALPHECDLVFHASGDPVGLDLSLRLAGFEGRVIELSWYGDKPVALSLGGAFHSRRLSVQSSQVATVALNHRARWDNRRRLAVALDLCADPRLDALVAEATPFNELPGRLRDILGRPGALCHLVRYPAR